jgi:hypothetical protein
MTALLPAVLLLLSQFPAPRATAVTPELKCDWGPVVSVTQGEHPTLVVETPAGPVTFQVTAEQPVLGPDKQARGLVSALKPATKVRVYYVRDKGARAVEVDLDG